MALDDTSIWTTSKICTIQVVRTGYLQLVNFYIWRTIAVFLYDLKLHVMYVNYIYNCMIYIIYIM